jgi:hypothetical protein
VTTAVELRQRVANLASGEGNSVDSAKYWREVLPPNWHGPYPPHWCGAFALWSLRVALGCDWHWEVEGVLGMTRSGFLYHLRTTKNPDLGDVCYMDQPYQHHAILTAVGTDVEGVPFIISQDGNSGPSPGVVEEHWRKRSKWTVFYSIEPLVQAALNAG